MLTTPLLSVPTVTVYVTFTVAPAPTATVCVQLEPATPEFAQLHVSLTPVEFTPV
jgi:hypothetical protein